MSKHNENFDKIMNQTLVDQFNNDLTVDIKEVLLNIEEQYKNLGKQKIIHLVTNHIYRLSLTLLETTLSMAEDEKDIDKAKDSILQDVDITINNAKKLREKNSVRPKY